MRRRSWAAQPDDDLEETLITAVDPDFVRTNGFRIALATAEFRTGDTFDAEAVWRALEERPGAAVINAQHVPTRANFAFNPVGGFSLEGVEGLFVENEVMDPVPVTIRDLDSARSFEVTVIGVIDDIASDPQFFLPPGMYTSTEFLSEEVGREIDVSMVWFETVPGYGERRSAHRIGLFRIRLPEHRYPGGDRQQPGGQFVLQHALDGLHGAGAGRRHRRAPASSVRAP